jgi:hypothetical protein
MILEKEIKINFGANFTAGGILYNEFYALKEILLIPEFNKLIKFEED